jgi:hypothetical protein
MTQNKQFIEITDLPTDNLGIMPTKLRGLLVQTFNTLREHPYKMTAFKTLLKFMYNTVVAFEKANAQSVKEPVKTSETSK